MQDLILFKIIAFILNIPLEISLLLEPVLQKIVPGFRKLPFILRKSIAIALTIAILIGSFQNLLLFIHPKGASAVWYDDAYAYRQRVDITGGSANQTDYQTLITINTSTLISAGKMQSDCDDIRITDVNGKLLKAWLEQGCNTSSTKIWVKTPSITTSGATDYLYYGNPSAASYWQIDQVFDTNNSLSYEFNTAGNQEGWTTGNVTGATVSNGVFSMTATSTDPQVLSPSGLSITASSSKYIFVKARITNASVTDGFYWVTNASPSFDEAKHTGSSSITHNGNWQIIAINVAADTDWANTVTQLRYDADATNGSSIEIDWIRVHNSGSTMPSTTPASEEKATGPIGYWKFNEGSGSVLKDSTANAINGSVVASSTWSTEDQCLAGKCFTTNGSGRGNVASNTKFQETANFSMNVWVRQAQVSTTGWPEIFAHSNTHIGYGFRSSKDSGNMYFEFGTGACGGATWSSLTLNSTNTTDNKWHMLTATHDGSTLRVYFDGVFVTSVATAGFCSSSGLAMYFANNLYGSVDEAKYYNFALSTAQIQANYVAKTSEGGSVLGANNQNLGALGNGLVAYYKTDESSGTSVADSSGNSNTGTLTTAQETGTAQSASTTTTIADGNNSNLSSTDDAYNGQTLAITGGVGCGVTTGVERIISDYTGSTKTFTFAQAYAAEPDNCTYQVRHQMPGKFGNSLLLDGSNDYVTVADSTSLDPTNVSLSVWVNPSAASNTYNPIFSKQNLLTNQGYWLNMNNSTRTLRFVIGTGSSNYADCSATSATALTLSSWNHVAATYNGTQIKVYVNNTEASLSCTLVVSGSSSSTSGTTISYTAGMSVPTNRALTFGTQTDVGGGQFYGKIDEARIYNRGLSPSEVSQLYAWRPGPTLYLKADEGTGTSANDSSANGYTGTLTDGPTWDNGKYGKGIKIDGTNDRIEGFTSDPFEYRGGDFTYSFWYKPTADSDGGWIFSKPWNGNGNYNVQVIRNSNNTIKLTLLDGATNSNTAVVTSATALTNGQWYHIGVALDGTAKKGYIYLNGVLDATGTHSIVDYYYTASSGDQNVSLSIGCLYPYNSGWGGDTTFCVSGTLDDMRYYNYFRTAGQIVEDMNASHPLGGSPVGSSVGWWKFNEGYGTTSAAHNSGSYGSGLDGSVSAASVWTQNGKFGKAVTTDGIATYASLPDVDGATDFTASQNFTVTFWVKDGGGNVNGDAVVEKWAGAGGYAYVFRYNSSNSLMFARYDGTNNPRADATNAINDGTWHHVAGVKDGSTLRLYVDGVQRSTTTDTTTGTTTNSSAIYIGSRGGTGQFYNGTVDELKVYADTLTADQIKLDMNQGSTEVLGAMSDMSGLSGGSVASGSAQAEYCIPGDTTSCNTPVARWDFEEGTSTTANDSSGNGFTGTLTNGPTWKPGKIGKAINFAGGTDIVSVTDTTGSALDLTTSMTFEAWIYPTSTAAYDPIIGKVPGGFASGYEFANSSGTLRTTLRTGVNCDYSAGALTANTWQHVVSTYDGTNTRHYINGILQGTSSNCTTGATANDTALYIGGRVADSQTYAGKIDQVRIFNYVRTPAQIAYDYNRGAPQLWWKLDDCQGTTIGDASGNGNSGTLVVGTGAGTNHIDAVGTCSTASSSWGSNPTGKRNYAITLDGVDDYISKSMTVNGSDGTVAFWVKNPTIGAAASGNYLFRSDANTRTYFQIANSSTQIVFIKGNPAVTCATVTAPAAGVWMHVVLKWWTTGGTTSCQAFTNGVSAGTAQAFTDTGNGSYSVLGAFTASGTQNAYGIYDDVRVYNYALTASQIKNLYNDGAVRYGPSQGSP